MALALGLVTHPDKRRNPILHGVVRNQVVPPTGECLDHRVIPHEGQRLCLLQRDQ